MKVRIVESLCIACGLCRQNQMIEIGGRQIPNLLNAIANPNHRAILRERSP